MNLIAAVDSNWAIGNKGQLLVRIPNDHKMFREETLDKVVVYGRKTLETFPHAKPLDRRTNIILSGNRELRVPGAQVVHSIEELLEACVAYPSNEIYIIGGASVYEQRISQRWTMPMRRMLFFPIWMRIRTGRSRRTAMS